MSLLEGRNCYKPFTHEKFFIAWENHEKGHWLHHEVSMVSDTYDWNNKLTDAQRNFLTNVFRFFTQGDVEVASAYHNEYIPLLGKLPEVCMMLGSFAARESVHIAAYSYLIETLGMPESTYADFLKYEQMKNKQDYLHKFSDSRHLIGKKHLSYEDKEHVALGIGLFSGGVEGIQLFSSFTMLLMFPMNGLMTGMGQIVTWSIADETQHVEGMIELFKTFVNENGIDVDRLKPKMHTVISEVVDLERDFIKLMFRDQKEFFGMTAELLELYIEFVADVRLKSMGFEPLYETSVENPIPEMSFMINAPTHTNFFENTSTDYSNVSYTGKWSDVWGC